MDILSGPFMKILFYLPVVTPWWFNNIVAPLIDRLVAEAEVHVMVPPLWCGTGIGPEQMAGVAAADRVEWHILDGEDHPRLRRNGDGYDGLLDLVHRIGPDLALCRSADLETPRLFGCPVRHMMEAAFPPFPSRPEWLVLRKDPFDHCVMPELAPVETDGLHAGFDAIWSAIRRKVAGQAPDDGLRDRREDGAEALLVSLPLEYEHEENFFGMHRPYADNAALVSALAEAVGDDVQLAVTDHPLNLLHCDRAALDAVMARYAGRVRLVSPRRRKDQPTLSVVRASDGMIVSNSKVISIAAFLGKPILRLSDHATGDWLNAYSDLPAFLGALRQGAPNVPSRDEAKTFFAFHAANNIIDPIHEDTDGRLILDMVESPVDRRRWPAAIRRYADSCPELVL
jgi:hypothetical protein